MPNVVKASKRPMDINTRIERPTEAMHGHPDGRFAEIAILTMTQEALAQIPIWFQSCAIDFHLAQFIGVRTARRTQTFVKTSWHRPLTCDRHIGCPTSSVAQANLTIRINFNILCSFSLSDILTIYLHTFLQSLYLSIHSRKTAFKVSRGISARITRIWRIGGMR
jgi:hypothetical protein